jgi:hypothetical protein
MASEGVFTSTLVYSSTSRTRVHILLAYWASSQLPAYNKSQTAVHLYAVYDSTIHLSRPIWAITSVMLQLIRLDVKMKFFTDGPQLLNCWTSDRRFAVHDVVARSHVRGCPPIHMNAKRFIARYTCTYVQIGHSQKHGKDERLSALQ